MENTNVELSENELALVTNAEFILTKNSIIEKVYALFGTLSDEYKKMTTNNVLPAEVLSISPKIYKGEQYRKLPYVMLDYPRFFTKESVFAIRSFFWWGNFFSISLHLSGMYKNNFLERLVNSQNIGEDWLFDTTEDEWNHELNKNGISLHLVVQHTSLTQLLERKYIKLSKKIPLEEWDKAFPFFIENYQDVLSMFRY